MKNARRDGVGALMMRSWLRRSVPLCVGAGLLSVFTLARAACTVSTTSVSFGAYSTFSASPADSTGTVTVECDATTAYSVAINAGGSGSFSRTMSSGADQMGYSLFTESTRTLVWGDGTGGTSVVTSSGTTGGVHTVYGRIPARQNVRVGSYADALIVTVEF